MPPHLLLAALLCSAQSRPEQQYVIKTKYDSYISWTFQIHGRPPFDRFNILTFPPNHLIRNLLMSLLF